MGVSTTTEESVVVTGGGVTRGRGRGGFRSLAEAIDAVAAVDALLASLAASRAVLMSDLGSWAGAHVESILSEPVLSGPVPSGSPGPEPEPVRGSEAEDLEEAVGAIVAGRLAEVLRVSPDAAAGLLEESRVLVRQHPRTLAALRGGTISYGHAQTILGYTCGLHRGGRAALETRLLRHARSATVAELSVIARAERERRLRVPRRASGRTGPVRQRRQMSSQAGGSPAWT